MDRLERFHETQVNIVERGRIGALAMQQHIRRRAIVEEFCRGLDLLRRAHAGRDHERLSGRGELGQQRQIGQVGGGDLVSPDSERFQRCDAGCIPRCAEVLNALRGAIGRDAALLIGGQFEAAQQIEGVFDREVVVLSRQAGGAIDFVELAHLEFRAIGACRDGGIDQRNRPIVIAVVVVADLGNDEARLTLAKRAVADLQRWFQSVASRSLVHYVCPSPVRDSPCFTA